MQWETARNHLLKLEEGGGTGKGVRPQVGPSSTANLSIEQHRHTPQERQERQHCGLIDISNDTSKLWAADLQLPW